MITDFLSLHVGDISPSDYIIHVSVGFMVHESALTGKAFLREKVAGSSHCVSEMTEPNTELFADTHEVGGKGRARVLIIGEPTEFIVITLAI